MQRARRVAYAALVLVVALCLSSVPAATPPFAAVANAATVVWPPSSLVVSELQTGGVSASDEFVEIANQGSGPVDLIGLEIVYATSSGSTVTRKATWIASTILTPGKRFLLANGAGSLAAAGDAVYSGGFAATGGALALRIVGGSVIDSIGWGDATNPFVEGTVAPPPPATSSLERRPGGSLGNGIDTNDNATDWLVTPGPSPQGLAAPPVPDPGPGPTPTPTQEPTPEPTPDPTPGPTPEPTSTPPPSPAPTATPEPTAAPTPTPEPTLSIVPIATARTMPEGSVVTVAGVLTTDLGALETGRTSFLQDGTGGIGLYLDDTVVTAVPAGTGLVITGTVDERYGQRTLRVIEAELVVGAFQGLPSALAAATGSAGESVEGIRIRVAGSVTAGPDPLADGSAVSVDDGSGPVRVIVTPAALGGRDLAVGSIVTAIGPLGQRDSTGTGNEGYRLYVTLASDLTVEPPPTPTPTATPTSAPTPIPTLTPDPTATPTPSPTPSRSPSTSPSPMPSGPTIAAARARPVGSTVTVRGVVTAEAGRLGTPSLLAIADATGGIVVKLPAGVATPPRGRVIAVTGVLADPYGQLEIRPAAAGIAPDGSGALPDPIDLPPSGPDESTEGRLVRLSGVVIARPTKATSGDIALIVETANGTRVKVMADASSGLGSASFVRWARYRIIAIAGQRATKKGLPDGYRVWVRDSRDVTLLAAAPTPTPRASTSPGSSGAGPSVIPIASALRIRERHVAIEAVVTAPARLLDGSGRRIVVQDASGAIEILLPKDTPAPPVGARVRAVGRVGSAYGAPRLRATAVERRGSASVPAPLRVAGPLTSTHTWRLVAISGRVVDVRKLGERWRAEILIGAQRLVVVAQPGARIPSTALSEGRAADILGIVRPAYPSASDRRPAILPRSPADVRQAAAASAVAGPGAGTGGGSSTSFGGLSPAGAALATASGHDAADADLVDLETLIGTVVRVGGLVVDLRPDGFTLDDGTATGRVMLTGPAGEWVDLIEPDDAINVIGRVASQASGEVAVVVDDPAAISLGSALDGLDRGARSVGDAPSVAPGGPPDLRIAGFGDGPNGIPGAGAGLLGLLAVGLVSLTVTAARRRHARHLLAVRVAARLAAIGGAQPADGGPGRAVPGGPIVG